MLDNRPKSGRPSSPTIPVPKMQSPRKISPNTGRRRIKASSPKESSVDQNKKKLKVFEQQQQNFEEQSYDPQSFDFNFNYFKVTEKSSQKQEKPTTESILLYENDDIKVTRRFQVNANTIQRPLSPPEMNTQLLKKGKEKEFYNQYLRLFENSNSRTSPIDKKKKTSPNKATNASKSLYDIATSYSPHQDYEKQQFYPYQGDDFQIQQEDSFLEVISNILSFLTYFIYRFLF